jgi:hypothetical protein
LPGQVKSERRDWRNRKEITALRLMLMGKRRDAKFGGKIAHATTLAAHC